MGSRCHGHYRVGVLLLFGMIAAGCAGKPPKGLGAPIADMPTRAGAQSAPDRYAGREVRWGGEILGVRNAPGFTDVEIYGQPLEDNAEPQPDGGDGLRFIARVPGFLDPVEYAAGKRMTVRGRLRSTITQPVGEFPYRYPLVMVETSHLWPVYEPPEPAHYHYPYWRSWGPWGPYRHRTYWW